MYPMVLCTHFLAYWIGFFVYITGLRLQFVVNYPAVHPASAAYEGAFCSSKLDSSAAAAAARSASFGSDAGPSTDVCGRGTLLFFVKGNRGAANVLVCMCACMHASVNGYVYVCVCVRVCVWMHTCIRERVRVCT